jgi:hypothetical protein
MLLLFLSRHSEATADRHSPPQKLYKMSHLIRERQKRGATAMDPKVIQLRVDAFDAVKNADGRRQNVQIYGLTPLMV